jgi:hypothetical protein
MLFLLLLLLLLLVLLLLLLLFLLLSRRSRCRYCLRYPVIAAQKRPAFGVLQSGNCGRLAVFVVAPGLDCHVDSLPSSLRDV